MGNLAQISTSKQMFRSSKGGGRLAAELFLAQRRMGQRMSPAALRVATDDGPMALRAGAVLRRDEFEHFDRVLVEETVLRLNGIAHLISRGLTLTIPRAMGKTLYTWEDVSDMEDAVISLSGLDHGDDDAVNFGPNSIPLPVIHKGFSLDLRTLDASREEGEPLSTLQARICARKVAEMEEFILFQGAPQFVGLPRAFGYTNHTNRNTLGFSVASWDQAGATGVVILDDVLAAKQLMLDDGYNGPWGFYTPTSMETKMDADFSSVKGDGTIRERLLRVEGVEFVTLSDQMTAQEVVMVNLTEDVVVLLDGERTQTIMWDLEGGWKLNFKVFAIQQPLLRATQSGNMGLVHLT